MKGSKTAESGDKGHQTLMVKVCWCAYRGTAEGVSVVGSVPAVALLLQKTNFVTSLTEQWQAQSYEAVDEEGKASAPGKLLSTDVKQIMTQHLTVRLLHTADHQAEHKFEVDLLLGGHIVLFAVNACRQVGQVYFVCIHPTLLHGMLAS